MLRLKEGVNLDGLHYRMIDALPVLSAIFYAHGQDLWITSANDSHDGGLHPLGRGLDLRTRFWDNETAWKVLGAVRQALGRGYDCILEENPPHIHIEWDPKP